MLTWVCPDGERRTVVGGDAICEGGIGAHGDDASGPVIVMHGHRPHPSVATRSPDANL